MSTIQKALDEKTAECGALLVALKELLRYRAHGASCEIEHTDFCTCGMKQAADRARHLIAQHEAPATAGRYIGLVQLTRPCPHCRGWELEFRRRTATQSVGGYSYFAVECSTCKKWIDETITSDHIETAVQLWNMTAPGIKNNITESPQ